MNHNAAVNPACKGIEEPTLKIFKTTIRINSKLKPAKLYNPNHKNSIGAAFLLFNRAAPFQRISIA